MLQLHSFFLLEKSGCDSQMYMHGVVNFRKMSFVPTEFQLCFLMVMISLLPFVLVFDLNEALD